MQCEGLVGYVGLYPAFSLERFDDLYTFDDTIRPAIDRYAMQLDYVAWSLGSCYYGNWVKDMDFGFGLKNWFLGGRLTLKFMLS